MREGWRGREGERKELRKEGGAEGGIKSGEKRTIEIIKKGINKLAENKSAGIN